MPCIPMRPRNVQNFKENDCNGTVIYRIATVTKNKKKTKNKMYTPHHTISHKHTNPKSEKQVKTDENSSPAGRLWYTLQERLRQRHDTTRQSRKTSSRTSTHTSPSCFHFTYFSAYTGGENTAPSSQCADLFAFSITSRLHT